MIFGLTYYEICFDFLVFSFLGWVLEVVFHALTKGKIINRGFLNGPVCPVYGFGVVGLLMLVNSLSSAKTEDADLFFVFAAGVVFCSAIELFAGWLLDKLFHMRWWDYSKEPFNLGGYICLRFSLLWGVGCVIVIDMIYPLVNRLSSVQLSQNTGWIIMLILYIVYLVDLIVTVAEIVGLNKKLKEIDMLKNSLRRVSDHMTQEIGTRAYKAGETISEQRVQAELVKEDLAQTATAMKADAAFRKQNRNDQMIETAVSLQMRQADSQRRLAELKKELTAQAGKKASGVRRIVQAFPEMHSRISDETMEDLKQQVQAATDRWKNRKQ